MKKSKITNASQPILDKISLLERHNSELIEQRDELKLKMEEKQNLASQYPITQHKHLCLKIETLLREKQFLTEFISQYILTIFPEIKGVMDSKLKLMIEKLQEGNK